MKRLFLLLGFSSLIACTNELEESAPSDEVNQITMTVKDFELDNKDSRMSVDVSPSGAVFKWSENDTVGIFPNEGGQVYFPMTNGAGTNQASFTGGGWALKTSSKYAAYYPYNFYNRDLKKIAVNYEGQTQKGNGSTAHLGAYDYMAAVATTPTSGKVNFDFQHLGCLVELNMALPRKGTLSSITLSSDYPLFVSKGVVDLTLPSSEIQPIQLSKSLTLNVENITTQSDWENVKIYMMMAPKDLTQYCVKVDVVSNGNTYKGTIESKKMLAGRYYIFHVKFNECVSVKLKNDGPNLANSILPYYHTSKITALEISGPLDGTDIKYLRSGLPNLEMLDLRNADIIEGGEAYYNDLYTKKDVFPQNFIKQANGLKKLKYIALPNSVIEIGNSAFLSDIFHNGQYPISTIEHLILGENVKTISGYICCSIKTLHIPENLEILDVDFAGCPFLESFTVSKKNKKYDVVDGVLYQGTTLYFCPAAKRKFEAPSDKKITGINGLAFGGCKFLKELIIPEGVCRIGVWAFSDCSSLEKVVFPSTLYDYQWYDVNSPFVNTKAMREIHIKSECPPRYWLLTTGEGSDSLPRSCTLFYPNNSYWVWNNEYAKKWFDQFPNRQAE